MIHRHRLSPHHYRLTTDILVIAALTCFAVWFCLMTPARVLTTAVLFMLAPATYLGFRRPKPWGRILWGTVVVGIMAGFCLLFIGEVNRAWAVGQGQFVFPWLILGIVPLDEWLWVASLVLYTLVFYEHFFETESHGTVSPNLVYGVIPVSVATVAAVAMHYYNPDLLRFDYAFALLGLCALLPFLLFISSKPHLIGKLLRTGVFFFYLFLALTLTNVSSGSWRYPGQYASLIQTSTGNLTMQTIFFWLLLGPAAILSFYEFFVDDKK